MRSWVLLFVTAVAVPASLHGQSGSAPGSRVAGLVAFDPKHDRLVVYGGMLFGPNANPVDADPRTYAWEGRGWSVIAKAGPRSRDEIAYGVDPRDGSIILVNGRGQGDQPPPGTPGPRIRERIPFRETWAFNGATWTRLDTLGPEGGASPQAAFDIGRGRLVFFGGAIGNNGRGPSQRATWEWDGKRWTRFDVPGPPGRRKRIYLYGGSAEANGESLADLWYLDNRKTWVRMQPRS
jgi:hypothetical protein